ncbi:MAG: dienelactone hydrolase family protein [Novosphingobium sp.]|nr:dienelactone hydrolase family protein [Novosphingobium sp.]
MSEFEPFPLSHDGASLVGQMIRPDGGGRRPAVLVMASAYGLGEHAKASARALAKRGWIAVATDMYGGGANYADPNAAGDDFAAIMAKPELLRARVVAWFEAVAAHPDVNPARVAAIGYCFGGRCVLELARSGADARAVVSFHGVLTRDRPAEKGAVRAIVQAWCGAQDPYAPIEDIAALRKEFEAAGATYEVFVFGHAAHSFTDPDAARAGRPGIEYDALADRVSWAGTLALLDTVLAD